MKKLVVLLLVLVAFSTFAGQIKLRNGQSYEGETLTFMSRRSECGAYEIGAIKKDGKAAFLAKIS